MSAARDFDLYSVLALTHRLPCHWEPYQAITEYLTGQPVPAPAHTIGLPEVCVPWLIAQHPILATIPPRPDLHTEEDMDAWAEQQARRIGAHVLPLRPLPHDQPRPTFLARLLRHLGQS